MNQKPTNLAVSMPAGLAMAGAVSLTATIMGSAILAWLTQKELIPQQGIGYGTMFCLLAASALGAITAMGRIKRRRLLSCALSGVVYFCCLFAITALFFGGQYSGIGVTALVVLAGSMAPALLRGGGGGKRRRRRSGR